MKTVLFLVLLLGSIVAIGQPNRSVLPEAGGPTNYTLLLKDGSIVSGRVVRRDSINLVVRQRNGRLTYVDLELFDRVVTDRTDYPASPAGAVGNAPVADTSGRGLADYLIFFKDGSQVTGRIVKRDSTTLVIRKRNGQFTYADPGLVETVQAVPLTNSGNSFAPIMLLNPTAYTADPGHLYYRNVLLFYNEFNYGISRNWSIGASIVPAAWFLSDSWYAESVSFSSKLSFPLGQLARIGLNGGYQPARTYEFFKQKSVWNLRAMASLGDSQRNVTIGYGRTSYGDTKQNRQPYITVGALLKLSAGLSFITDNTIYTNQNQSFATIASLFSAAIRFDRPRHTFDVGLLGQTYAFSFFTERGNPRFYPYLAYTVRFGR